VGEPVTEEITSLNELCSQVLKGKFGLGKTRIDDILAPLNRRGNCLDLTDKYYSIGPGLGLHYSAKKPMQTLAVLETRYFNVPDIYPYTVKEMYLAREIVNLWAAEHFKDVSIRPILFDDFAIDAAYSKFLSDAQTKDYADQYHGSGGWDGPDGRTVKFHLKTIFKPKLKPDLYKVGQGISAWSTQTLAIYCVIFRVISETVIKLEKYYVVSDAYWTEPQFIEYLNNQFSSVPHVAPFGVTDGEMFDACQNRFTQEIEKQFLRRLGVSETMLDHYYSFRAGYYVKASSASGHAGTQKTSGEPGTFFNNGVVSKTISNWLLRGVGPQAIVNKGDDFVKRQCNLQLDVDRKRALDVACGLRIRVNISDGADFCGLILEDGKVFPSVVRKANKIISHRFKNYEHFTEYQESLRDWVGNVEKYGAETVIGSNAKLYKTNFEHMSAIYDGIRSMSHIGEEQFRKTFMYREEEAGHRIEKQPQTR
jgi:hypothetical protein